MNAFTAPFRDPRRRSDYCATEAPGSLAIDPRAGSSLATLLSHHALRDGEVVLLALKPSLWYVLLSSLRFIAALLIAVMGIVLAEWRIADHRLPLIEVTLFLIFGRITVATLQWMSRLYVLTDQRILRVKGVFRIDVFDCPLRQVVRLDLLRSTRERLFRLGTIAISPADPMLPLAQWQMIARPRQVLARVQDAVDRAKRLSGGSGAFAAA